ncbi:MAG: hypothetical protein ABSD38_10350 [Syntrophorhabdales bacterium]|jgi:hypothetical protein
MDREYDLKGMDARIREIRKTAEEIREVGQGIEAVRRNVDRILASVKMIELNVCDVVEVL